MAAEQVRRRRRPWHVRPCRQNVTAAAGVAPRGVLHHILRSNGIAPAMMQDFEEKECIPSGAHMTGPEGGGRVVALHLLCVAAAQLAEREGAVSAHAHLAPRRRVGAGRGPARGRRWGGGSAGGVCGGCRGAGAAAAAAAAAAVLQQLDGVLLLNPLARGRSASACTRIMIGRGRRVSPPSVWTSSMGLCCEGCRRAAAGGAAAQRVLVR